MIRVYAHANLPVDSDGLRHYCESEVMKYPQIYQGAGRYFGGWSVTSGTGEYSDGWQAGQHALRGARGREPAELDQEKFQAMFPVRPRNMRTQTQFYRGPIEILMREIERRCANTGILPSRVRLSKLDAHGGLPFHRDAPNEDWRLHIPISTNSRCAFEWDLDGDSIPEHRLHMPLGTAWFVRVDHLHRFVNAGDEPRLHLVMSLVSWRDELIGRFNSHA